MNLADSLPIQISESAWSEIVKIYNHKNIPQEYGLRIGTQGGGCSGVSYILGFDKKKETDKEYIIEGITIYIEKKHIMFLMGMVVDFEESDEGRGFVFNPI
jgi:iron-sulfur cluster assembly protein